MRKNKLFFIPLLSTVLLFHISKAHAQKDNVWGSWIISNIEYGFSPELYGYFELQTRSQSIFRQFYYYEVKGGIGYRINDNFSALIGFGNYGTYDWMDLSAPKVNDELRLWEQFVMTQPLKRIRFEHRFRAEQATINNTYRNRFRYRLSLLVPLNRKQIAPGTLYAVVFDELFLTDKAPYFMRNRIYAGLAYPFNAILTVNLGWVNQFNYSLSTSGAKDNLLLSLGFRL